MKRNIFRVIGCLCVLLIIGMLMSAPQNVNAETSEQAKKEKEEMEAKLKDTESALASLENVKEDTETYIRQLDGYITSLSDNVYELNQQITGKQQEIAQKEQEIEDKEQQINEQYEAMKLRIQYMYENGEISYLTMFFESSDMSDFLNRAEYLADITDYDRKMLIKLQNDKDSLEMAKAALDIELADLNDMLEEVKEEQAAQEVLLQAKEQELSTTNAGIETKEQAILQLEADIEAQEQIIAELEEQERKYQEMLAQQGGNGLITMYDGGKMAWPLPGYNRLSSYFGYRIDPFTGLTAYHSGIDIPAPTGTTVYSAYAGRVAWTDYNIYSGYHIGIDHGNGVKTIYMHLSKFLVSPGDYVAQGQAIALVGATGLATGPHLHFGVTLDGVLQQPLDYVDIPE